MKIKKVQSVCLILACVVATGLIGCGKTDETPKKHEAITFMAHLTVYLWENRLMKNIAPYIHEQFA